MSEPIKPRESVSRLSAFAPGETAKSDFTRLHLFENPYPPPLEVIEELLNLQESRLRLYPDPVSFELRTAISASFRLKSRQVFVTCGSNQVLRLLAHAFVDPGQKIGCLWPTYLFYEHIAAMCGAELVKLNWLDRSQEEALDDAPDDLKLLYVASPNPPHGLGVESKLLEQFALEHPQTLVVIDEAYCAFAGTSALRLVRNGLPNVVVTRSFSKSHSIAGVRIGFAMGQDEVLAPLFSLKEPFNVNVVSQVLGLAAWRASDWLAETVGKITMTRSRVRIQLQDRGFRVPQSQGNFLFVRGGHTDRLISGLREKAILVRASEIPELQDGFSVSIGTEEEMNRLLTGLDGLREHCPRREAAQ